MIHRSMMVDKKLTMDDIQAKISEEYGELLEVIVSDTNAPKLVVRVRIFNEEGEGGEGEANDETMKKLDSSYLRDLKLQVRVRVMRKGERG